MQKAYRKFCTSPLSRQWVFQVTHFTCAGNNITLEGLETWEGGGLLIDEERGEQLLLSSES